MLPDKCHGNSQYFHCGGHICHRWAGGQSGAQMGTPPSRWRWRTSCSLNQMSSCDWSPWISSHEQRWDLMKVWQKSCIKVKLGGMQWNIRHHVSVILFSGNQTVNQWIEGASWYASDCYTVIKRGTDNCLIMLISPLENITITIVAAQSLCCHKEGKFIAPDNILDSWLVDDSSVCDGLCIRWPALEGEIKQGKSRCLN